ncbi:MAG: 30S ribosomal protein S1 [Calditrichaeota bacterium]|nr:30S ribosomal protein S1 [Calditrichota bacterium]
MDEVRNQENLQHPAEEQPQAELEQQGGEVQAPEAKEAEATETKATATKSGAKKDLKILALEEETADVDYTPEEAELMARLYDSTMMDFVEGTVVRGKVLAVDESGVTVDIGFKSEGVIPLEEFPNPEELKIGDDIEVFLDGIEDLDGQLVLSKKRADFMRAWEKVRKAWENDEIVEGRITRRIKGGLIVDLGGVDAFLPGSQIDVRPIRDFDSYIGQTMTFKIVKLNDFRKNVVVSHRVLVEDELKEQREKILANLERGQVLEGIVKNITDFGVFIDLGGVDGLLHINDLSWGRVSHPSEIVQLDQKIQVMVLDFNESKDRISLGLKQLQPHPWDNVDVKYPEGSVVEGRVVSICDYGAFVELEKGVEGLIHISEMSWTQHIKHPSQVLKEGQIIKAKVLNVRKDERKISLGLKQLEPDPWETLEQKYPVGTIVEGKVRNLTNFGAFVELEEGIDGLVHISDLSWTKKIRHPGEVLEKGQTVKVVVLGVDRQRRRISLGYKQTMPNPWDRFEELYLPGTMTKGKIVRLLEKGLIVELPEEVEGFVPLSHLARTGINKPADGYQLGEELDLYVIEFSKDNKRIVLSEKRALEKLAKEAEAEKTEAAAAEGEAAETEAAEGEAAETEAAEAKTSEGEAEQTEAAEAEKPEAEAAAEPEEAKEEAAQEEAAEPEGAAAEATEEPKEAEATEAAETEAATEAAEEETAAAEAAPEEAKAEEAAAEPAPEAAEAEEKPKKRTRKTSKAKAAKAEEEAEKAEAEQPAEAASDESADAAASEETSEAAEDEGQSKEEG